MADVARTLLNHDFFHQLPVLMGKNVFCGSDNVIGAKEHNGFLNVCRIRNSHPG